ncbi:hypothetical protein D8785_07105 [Streptococcus australis]|jgi:hypothetical protein|nr:hypothetical protein D8785_07105 [Streptococcus australis]
MLWEKISENWTVYKLCLKADIGPAGIYRFFVLESFLDRAYK